ncbi:MAG: preprotein translocase subunit SecE [Desulfovibrio sp.]|jgi:preprotein translocase subunit SecE|nr:preprotein translocase subunit SecE [Desulfovibrio sp.]
MTAKQIKQDKGTGGKPLAAPAAAPSKIVARFRSLIRYFEDARNELGKVSWPTAKEVRVTSLAVLVLVVLMSLFLGLADFLFANLMDVILTRGGR